MRILGAHPESIICVATSRQYGGRRVADIFPSLTGLVDMTFSDPGDMDGLDGAELVFTALPHKTSQGVVAKALGMGKRVIDLSADFRLKDPAVYEEWYCEHIAREILDRAVYGLPELYRDEVKGTDIVASAGCYPTGAILGLLPLLKKRVIDPETIVIDSKSGMSGAGRVPSLHTSFVEVNEGCRAYKIGEHRHIPEIEQELSAIAGCAVRVSFTPHLLPVSRGILSTIYAGLACGITTKKALSIFIECYSDEPFIRVMGEGVYPDILQVKGSNFCDIGVKADERTGRIIVVTAIDNLMKGASGQAVQNMNIMYGLPEDTGLLPQRARAG